MSEAEAKYRRWLQRRKSIVEEHFPEVCTCYIGKVYMKAAKPCKNCEVCPGCEQHIKNECWKDHALSCRALVEIGADVNAETRI